LRSSSENQASKSLAERPLFSVTACHTNLSGRHASENRPNGLFLRFGGLRQGGGIAPRDPEERRDDPAESGALEEEATGSERPPAHDEPVASGAVENEPLGGDE
jgi:hypothetical protein